jgi:hypothetical protein
MKRCKNPIGAPSLGISGGSKSSIHRPRWPAQNSSSTGPKNVAWRSSSGRGRPGCAADRRAAPRSLFERIANANTGFKTNRLPVTHRRSEHHPRYGRHRTASCIWMRRTRDSRFCHVPAFFDAKYHLGFAFHLLVRQHRRILELGPESECRTLIERSFYGKRGDFRFLGRLRGDNSSRETYDSEDGDDARKEPSR